MADAAKDETVSPAPTKATASTVGSKETTALKSASPASAAVPHTKAANPLSLGLGYASSDDDD
jgi:hypothetical protein